MEIAPEKKGKMPYAIAAVLIVVIVVGVVYYFFSGANSLTVVEGDNVSVYYTGSFTNGTVFGSNVGQQPLQFTVGANETILGFDQAVMEMKLNQTKNVTIPVDEAYGPVNPQLIIQIPVNTIATTGSNTSISVGSIITRTSNGRRYQGIVTSVNSITATVDFNPPLAGHDLVFTIKVVKIQTG